MMAISIFSEDFTKFRNVPRAMYSASPAEITYMFKWESKLMIILNCCKGHKSPIKVGEEIYTSNCQGLCLRVDEINT